MRTCSSLLLALALCIGCSSETTPDETTAEPRCASSGERDEAVLAEMEAVAGTADDAAFYMLNLIKFREQACYEDGRETQLTGEEADGLYAPLEFLLAIGAQIVFVADVEQTLISADGTAWDTVAIVRYPSRAALLEMTNDPEFQERIVHKWAGIEKTIVMMSELRPSQLPSGFMPVEGPHPTTPDDPALEMVHVMKFYDEAMYPPDSGEPARTGQEAVALYEQSATAAALALGVYPVAWFDVVDVVIGDGRAWQQLRINHMPSMAAFQALVADDERKAGEIHRQAGLEDTYSVLTTPIINTLDPFAN